MGGALAGGAVVDKLAARNWGSLVLALDPARLGDPADFGRRVTALLQRVKAARKAPGVDEILLPGERSLRQAGACLPFPNLAASPSVISMARRCFLHSC